MKIDAGAYQCAWDNLEIMGQCSDCFSVPVANNFVGYQWRKGRRYKFLLWVIFNSDFAHQIGLPMWYIEIWNCPSWIEMNPHWSLCANQCKWFTLIYVYLNSNPSPNWDIFILKIKNTIFLPILKIQNCILYQYMMNRNLLAYNEHVGSVIQYCTYENVVELLLNVKTLNQVTYCKVVTIFVQLNLLRWHLYISVIT